MIDLQKRPLSFSSLKEFSRSPAHYAAYIAGEKKQTPAMLLGRLVHAMIPTPGTASSEYVRVPEINRRTNEGKAQYAEILARSEGKALIDDEQWAQAEAMSEAVRTNSASKEILMRITQTEKKFNVEIDGLPFVGYIDAVGDDLIAEIKTTTNSSPEAFARDAFSSMYHLQAAIYMQAEKQRGRRPDFYYIAVEKTPPYGVSVMKATDAYIQCGEVELARLLPMFKMCLKENLFSESYDFFNAIGYSQLDAPLWAKAKYLTQ